jgi:hypothetical protein
VLRFFLAAFIAVAFARVARAECTVERDAFICPEWGVEMVVPRDWELSAQTSYPGILAAGVHRPGKGRLTLAAQTLQPGDTAKIYAERNRQALKKVGFRVEELSQHTTGAYVLDAMSPDRKRRLRQGYTAHDGVAYVVTVAAPAQSMKSYLRAFDDTLRGIRFTERETEEPAMPEEPTDPTLEPAPAPPASDPTP